MNKFLRMMIVLNTSACPPDIAEIKIAMRDESKTKKQLITELTELRQWVSELDVLSKHLSAVHQSSQRLQYLYSPEKLAQEIIGVLEASLDYEYGAVLLIDESTKRLLPFALSEQGQDMDFVEKDKAYIASHDLRVGVGITGWVAQAGQSVRIGDVRQDVRYYAMRSNLRSELCVPLRTKDKVIGVVNIETPQINAYTEIDQQVLESIASQIAIAIQNTQLFERVITSNLQLSQLNRAIEQAAEAVIITNLDGEIEYVNPAFERITGYDRDEALGQNPRILKSGEQDDVFYREMWQTILDGDVWHGSIINRKKSGDLYHEEMTIAPVLDELGDIINFVAIKHDVTDQVRANERLHRQIDFLEAIRSIDKAITASADLKLSCDSILDQAYKNLKVDAVDILLFNPTLLTLECAGRKGFKTSALQYTNLRLGQGFAGKAALERKIVSVLDIRAERDGFLNSPELVTENFISYYGVPLTAKGKLMGVLEIFHRSSLSPDDEWLIFLDTLAGQTAIAIDNASLFTNLQQANVELHLAYDNTLEGWARALELRDMETEGHSRRVTEMTVRLARMMGIGDAELIQIRRGALLHDIGKMGIPDSVLFKADKLTSEEWDIMRRHPVYAYEMLSTIAYLRPALDIPYCHHEKWDGTGYPRGFKGEEIPLSARIFAIVDVWDALTYDRPYRKAWSHKKALDYICEQAGEHFDPQVVEAFLKLIEVS